jgi:hypothetical protein
MLPYEEPVRRSTICIYVCICTLKGKGDWLSVFCVVDNFAGNVTCYAIGGLDIAASNLLDAARSMPYNRVYYQRRGFHGTRRLLSTQRTPLIVGLSAFITGGLAVLIAGASNELHLDSNGSSRFLPSTRGDFEHREDPTQRRRSFIDYRLTEHQQSHITDQRCGISRYDVAQVAR